MDSQSTIDLAVLWLLGMTIGCMLVRAQLFARLERMHPEKFEELGRPSIIEIRSVFSTHPYWKRLRFVWRKEHRDLNDPYLSKLCSFMAAFQAAAVLLVLWVVFKALTCGCDVD